jgi:hypothetical protein
MGRGREALQLVLEGLTANVYFQPPTNLQIKYPCILYERDAEDVKHANNRTYNRKKRYLVTVIDRDPDSAIPDKVGDLELCRFSRHFIVDGLHHDVYNLYY